MVAEKYKEFVDDCFEEEIRALTLAKEVLEFGNYERARELVNEGYTAAFAHYRGDIEMRNYFLERFKSETQEDTRRELRWFVDFHSRAIEESRKTIEIFEKLEELITQEANKPNEGEK